MGLDLMDGKFFWLAIKITILEEMTRPYKFRFALVFNKWTVHMNNVNERISSKNPFIGKCLPDADISLKAKVLSLYFRLMSTFSPDPNYLDN